jgi:hypothetical protein
VRGKRLGGAILRRRLVTELGKTEPINGISMKAIHGFKVGDHTSVGVFCRPRIHSGVGEDGDHRG